MSVQFGKCNFDGKPVDPEDLAEVRPVLAGYGPDGEGYICRDNFAVLYRAFHTTKESRHEIQPHICPSGAVITWDGRLDNREELIGLLARETSASSTDLEIVAASHERWGTDSFARLIGDWALSIWDPRTRSLFLAKDFIGARHLYYSLEKDRVTWSTILDPLVLFAGCSFELEEEYIAGWLSFFPATHLTPYIGIRAVAPATFVQISQGSAIVKRHWDFDALKKIRYKTDAEYEEHFRSVFSESIRRRLRSEKPVLAELSGGIDSSSIVCVADQVLSHGPAETPRLDTVSYYDDSEPNWNERPFFTNLEEHRDRIGCHIDVSGERSFGFTVDMQYSATPAFLRRSSREEDLFADYVRSRKNRVLLSGIGGDEVTGGQPSPNGELADLLATFQFRALAHQLKLWSLNKRQPWFHLLASAAQNFLPIPLTNALRERSLASLLRSDFIWRNCSALLGYPQRVKFLGGLPSFQECQATLNMLQRQLASCPLPKEPTIEMRYPYLDRCFLEFLYAIPREQLVRPSQRRSLMRRALIGIVPKKILDRRRKAYSMCAPRAIIASDGAALVRDRPMQSVLLGIVSLEGFSAAVGDIQLEHDAAMVPLLRLIVVESWLQNLARTAPGLLRWPRHSELPVSSMQISAEKSKPERR
jgi:asparagine synthase (glutamine-hydrolysing)